MNLNDDELQKAIEAGKATNTTDADETSYRLVFDSLSKERRIGVSNTFADKVIQKVLTQKQVKESSGEIWWLVVGIFMMLVALIIAIGFAGAKFDLGFLKAMNDYKGLLLAGAVLILIFNMLDRKLVRSRVG